MCVCVSEGGKELVCMRLCFYANLCRVFVYVQPPGCERGWETVRGEKKQQQSGKSGVAK